MTTARKATTSQIITQAHALAPLGWTVEDTKAGVTIHAPSGDTVGLHTSGGSDHRSMANLAVQLEHVGFTDACTQLAQLKKTTARTRTAAARSKISSISAVAKPGAAAAFSSAGTDDTPRPSATRGMMSRVETITPQRAQELLDRAMTVTLTDGTQIRQRSINEPDVANFVKLLQAGRWLTMPDGVSLSADGSLLDGRHRLTAIARAGVPVDVYIHYNVAAETFAAFDTGRRRTAPDTLRMAGYETDVLPLASAVKLMACYDGWLADPNGYPAWSTWSRLKFTNADVVDLIHRYPTLVQDVQEGRNVQKSRLVAASTAVFRQIARRAWPQGEDKLIDFCWGLRTGEDLHFGNPAYTLREWALRTPARNIACRREANLVMLLKCWNAYAVDKEVRSAPRWGIDQNMVAVYQPSTRRAATAA